MKALTKVTNWVILVFVMVTIYFGKVTGTTGGEIRHTEIRENYTPIPDSNSDNMPEEDDD